MIKKIKKKRKTFDNQDSVILYNIYNDVSFYVFFEKNI